MVKKYCVLSATTIENIMAQRTKVNDEEKLPKFMGNTPNE